MERKSPNARRGVGFGPDPRLISDAAGPASPRSQKILSRKKTPFTEDLADSLAEFQAEALAIHRAQKEARAEERRRLADNRSRPTQPLPERSSARNSAATRSVTIVTPQSAATAAAAKASADADTDAPDATPADAAPEPPAPKPAQAPGTGDAAKTVAVEKAP